MARYLVNSETKEIHDKHSRETCNVDAARKAGNIREVGVREYTLLLKEGFDLCGHCYKDDEE